MPPASVGGSGDRRREVEGADVEPVRRHRLPAGRPAFGGEPAFDRATVGGETGAILRLSARGRTVDLAQAGRGVKTRKTAGAFEILMCDDHEVAADHPLGKGLLELQEGRVVQDDEVGGDDWLIPVRRDAQFVENGLKHGRDGAATEHCAFDQMYADATEPGCDPQFRCHCRRRTARKARVEHIGDP